MKSPAFQFYPADFLADENVIAMSLEDRGALITSICEAAMRRDVEALNRLRFIGRVLVYRSNRAGVPLLLKQRVLSVGKCASCGCSDSLQVDHRRPVSKGGTNDPENLQCLCQRCNRTKSDHWSAR